MGRWSSRLAHNPRSDHKNKHKTSSYILIYNKQTRRDDNNPRASSCSIYSVITSSWKSIKWRIRIIVGLEPMQELFQNHNQKNPTTFFYVVLFGECCAKSWRQCFVGLRKWYCIPSVHTFLMSPTPDQTPQPAKPVYWQWKWDCKTGNKPSFKPSSALWKCTWLPPVPKINCSAADNRSTSF